MAKPWGRIELDHINHDKFRALNANAICLWHEGKNYCDLRHADGLIPLTTAKQFRFYSKKSVAFLMVSAGRKPGTEHAYAPLWEAIDGFGYKMHDYLEHNPSRERVLEALEEADLKAEERRQQADESRMVNNERLKRWRDIKKAKRNADETPDETPSETVSETLMKRCETPMKRSSYVDVDVDLERDPSDLSRVSVSPPQALAVVTDVGFDAFWKVYPRKTGKDAARKEWKKRHFSAELQLQILAALAWQKQQDAWIRDGGQFVPHPATWLNQGRWEDEPIEAPVTPTNKRIAALVAGGDAFLKRQG